MHSIKDNIRLLIYLIKLTNKYNWRFILYNLFFIYYILIKLNKLLKMQLKLYCIPNEIYSYLMIKHEKSFNSLVDNNLYILCNFHVLEESKKWYYLCSKVSKKKYKVMIVFTNYIEENNIYVSESMKLNINKKFNLENSNDCSYFLIPIPEESIDYAAEVKVSLISNPFDCTNELIDRLLKSFFSSGKYLRINDIFSVDVKGYLPETKYILSETKLNVLYFKVNHIKFQNHQTNGNGGFAVYEKTSLIQEANVNSYIPQKCMCAINLQIDKRFSTSWPPVFKKPIEQIQSCIFPFLQTDFCINLKPVFLVDGPIGSRKFQLMKIIAETLGLHLLAANLTDLRYLTPGQIETKLQQILYKAESCNPCILLLQNIQIFGIDSEGHIDERIFLVFKTEIEKLYNKKLKYPVVIIATSDNSEIPIDSDQIFIEKINIAHLSQEERFESLSWIIESRGLAHKVDLLEISKMCSNFVLTDLELLVSHAVKNRFQLLDSLKQNDIIELLDDDFTVAYEYMQTLFSDEIGAPTIPKVHWEDIGGLAELKHEIIRRIKLPLLNISNISKSGLLLYGPPGTGKTLLAKAVATECKLHFLSVKGPELLNMYVGQSEKNIRQVFDRARSASPCIIFFDELDSLVPKRGQSGDSGGVMDRVVSQLLTEMDGLDNSGKIFVIAATNRPDLVDPALLRPGRFDKMLYVGVCTDPESRLSVLKALTRNFNMEKDGAELEMLVQQLPDNLTGADLYSICSNAWLAAVRRLINDAEFAAETLTASDVIVKMEDFLDASRNLMPSVSKEELMRYEKLRDELSAR